MPLDRFQRNIDYLRISVIDRCNLRCTYCMPMEDLQFAPSSELMTPVEIEKLVRASVASGFKKFRLTGGEPLLRSDIVEIVERCRSVEGVDSLAMTTNAYLLPKLAPALAKAGLTRVNIHIDTLNPLRLRQVMRLGDLGKAQAGIDAAEAAGLVPIKLNSVVVKGMNEQEVVELAALTLERDWHVRFIELMPLGGGECASYSRANFVSNECTQERLELKYGKLEELPKAYASDESKNYKIAGAKGVVGFISPVSDSFCGTCNRLRVTARGRLNLCLLHAKEVNVKELLSQDGGEEELQNRLQMAVSKKPTGHKLLEGISNDLRSMYHMGG